MALQLQRVGGMEPCRSHGALDDDRTGTRLRGHLGLCAARLSEIEADLPPAGKLDIDLCKKLGVKQSAMFDAVRTIDAISGTQCIKRMLRSRMTRPGESQRVDSPGIAPAGPATPAKQIGRASCRDRGCQKV